MIAAMVNTSLKGRAARARERQLAYQQEKSIALRGREAEVMASMAAHSLEVRLKLESFRSIPPDARVLEVGSGAHGLIFFFDAMERVGVDPLAAEYKVLFPAWQDRAHTIAADGERLPFPDDSFDVVLCDNVVDHAEGPRRIVEEIVRVLAPHGLLYFTVNVHHPFYHVAATAHAALHALGIRLEITPFADHTVHLTPPAARSLFEDLPLRFLAESDTVDQTKRQRVKARHVGDQLKRLFYKNAQWELIALKR
jgi:SAM-dependent methyltransferase